MYIYFFSRWIYFLGIKEGMGKDDKHQNNHIGKLINSWARKSKSRWVSCCYFGPKLEASLSYTLMVVQTRWVNFLNGRVEPDRIGPTFRHYLRGLLDFVGGGGVGVCPGLRTEIASSVTIVTIGKRRPPNLFRAERVYRPYGVGRNLRLGWWK